MSKRVRAWKLPPSVTVAGERYQIVRCDALRDKDDADICGYVEPNEPWMLVARNALGKRMTDKEAFATAVHEIAHIILKPDGALMESFVAALETAMARAVTELLAARPLRRAEKGGT